jgi:hypothetical protein
MSRTMLWRLATAAVLATAAGGAAPAQAQYGTQGVIVWESGTDHGAKPKPKGLRAGGQGPKGAPKRKGEFPVESFSWGQSSLGTTNGGPPGGRNSQGGRAACWREGWPA